MCVVFAASQLLSVNIIAIYICSVRISSFVSNESNCDSGSDSHSGSPRCTSSISASSCAAYCVPYVLCARSTGRGFGGTTKMKSKVRDQSIAQKQMVRTESHSSLYCAQSVIRFLFVISVHSRDSQSRVDCIVWICRTRVPYFLWRISCRLKTV